MVRVLIVEDEPVLRLTFSQFLKDEGYTVATAEGYDEAVRHLDLEDFDVIVTDIILAGNTGVDLLRYVHERESNTMVVMITGEPNVETASEAVRLGAFEYLSKPVTGRELKRVVRMAVDRKRLKEERDQFLAQRDRFRRELEAIFHSVNEGIVTVDSDLRMRQINLAAQQMLGLSERHLGKSLEELLDEAFEPVRRALKETIAHQAPITDIRVSGAWSSEGEKMLVVSTLPLVAESAVHTGAIILMRDVTRLILLEKQLEGGHIYRNMVGKSPRMREIFELVENVAETDSTVLICGESGTGKELVAAALHNASARSKKPFIKVNCAALAEEILESELFGHVKGAFTGAVRDRVGRFEAANGGTILLDEIGDISPRLQLRLLRVLQEREFERVGDSVPIHVDVRIIASTNQDLSQRIGRNEFREDLYYRLNVIRVELPPLRERRDDIPLLVDFMCRRFNTVFKKEILGLSPETMEIVMNYPWWGNIRELENCMERAFIVCHDPVISPHHLPSEILNYSPAKTAQVIAKPAPGRYERLSREHLLEILEKTDWNVAKAARKLGIARNTLYQKMKSYDLERVHDL
ncbi:MAG: sigma 54-interacting transcriptional regulator [Candidatus Hydrogenedentes bacterium]|nr:sigma 54-interacting transcriptional regulator [Candidatus Hydrogenedentota bacterium]